MKTLTGTLTDMEDQQEYQTTLKLDAGETEPGPEPTDPLVPQEVLAEGGNLTLDLTKQPNANITVGRETVLLVPKVDPGHDGAISVLGDGLTLHADWKQSVGQSDKIADKSVIAYYSPATGVVVATIWQYGNGS